MGIIPTHKVYIFLKSTNPEDHNGICHSLPKCDPMPQIDVQRETSTAHRRGPLTTPTREAYINRKISSSTTNFVRGTNLYEPGVKR